MAALFVLTAIASPSGASVEAVKDTTQTVWPSTIYYIASIKSPDGEGAGYGDVTFNITAVSDYKLYVNGTYIGDNADGDWRTVEHYDVTLPAGDVNIGVEVYNDGTGDGNGLMVDIAKDDSANWLGTSIKKRRSETIGSEPRLYRVQWFYYSGSPSGLQAVVGDGNNWYEAGPSKLYVKAGGTQLDQSIARQFKAVLLGSMGDINYLQNTKVDIITGYAGNADVSSTVGGGIKLRRVEGENLALGRPSNKEELVNGDLANGLDYTSNPVGADGYKVDLERIYRVNEMVLFTGGDNPANWATDSVRGFNVEISFDDFTWNEVGVLHDIGEDNEGGHDYYAVEFPEEWARYLRYNITESRIDYPNVGELMVYGVGHVYDGVYESDWLDFGSQTTIKNFDMVSWDGQVPEGTKITVQLKSAYMTQEGQRVESEWSLPTANKSFAFPSPEPATMMKYRVNLSTQNILSTPVFNLLSVTYSEDDQPVLLADGYVSPNTLPMGKTTTMEYVVSYNLVDGQNLKQVQLSVPGFSSLNSVYSSELGRTLTEANTMLAFHSSVDTLYINFTDPIVNSQGGTASDSLYISFDTKLLGNNHDFIASLFNAAGNDGAGGIEVWESRTESWTVVASSISEGVLLNVQASPEAFTPNGDGVNEFTVIEFELSKVQTDVKINIYDTKGSLVTVVADEALTPGTYLIPDSQKLGANALDLVGYWDGRDEDGDLVAPGVYVYQVVAQTDDGDKIKSGTVVVAY